MSSFKFPLLHLPLDIFFEGIFKYLDLHDEFQLYRTCRDLQVLMKRKWPLKFSSLSRSEQFDILTGLAYPLLDCYVCAACCKIHRAEERDLRWFSQYPACQMHLGHRFDSAYGLRHSHVQMALKLSQARTLTQTDRRRFEGIMSVFYKWEKMPGTNLSSYYCARPKVVGDRFLLHTVQGYRHPILASLNHLFTESGNRRICPHLSTKENEFSTTGALQFDADMLRTYINAVNLSEQEVHYHCKRCPTDYSMQFLRGAKIALVISSWHDLGQYQSPVAEGWTAHVRTAGNNIFWPGPTLHHQAGSVRRMYLGI